MLHLVRGRRIVGALALEDEVRPEARQAVAELHALGVERVVMITGDARQVADSVAAEVGVDEVFAEVLPEDKDSAVAELQQRGLTVAMVGDGVNDAPALARADVGLAIGAGTDVAIESAGVVLATSDPRAVAGVIRLSRASYRKMVQNLAWAAGYNVVSIPLAAGVPLPPVVACRRRQPRLPGAREEIRQTIVEAIRDEQTQCRERRELDDRFEGHGGDHALMALGRVEVSGSEGDHEHGEYNRHIQPAVP